MRPSDPTLPPQSHREEFSWKDSVEAKWDVVKGSVRKQWGKLTDDDLQYVQGQREKLIGKLMDRYQLTREQVESQLSSWQQSMI